MLGYTKNPPTTYVLHYQNGRLRRQGAGLAFWYYRPASMSDMPDFSNLTIVAVGVRS